MGSGRYAWSKYTGLVDANGDAELWLRLCNLNNRPLVRVLVPQGSWKASTTVTSLTITPYSLYWGDSYGANPVMDHHGNVATGIDATNLLPLCVAKPSDATQKGYADAALAAQKVNGNQIPYCPDGIVQSANQLQWVVSPQGTDFVDGRKWAARGAINAALAVFSYLDDIERNPSHRKPLYNQCNLLGQN